MKKQRNNTRVLRDKNGKWKKGTPPPNPAGAPKRGQSWKEIWSETGNMSPLEAAKYCKVIAGQLATIGGEMTLKQAVVLRVYAALLFEPDARLLNSVMDRDEGKVTQPMSVETWRDKVITLLREKKVAPEDVIQEFGDDLATELFVGAGIPRSEIREVTPASQSTGDK